jgi:hypothetical protein
MTDPNSHDDGIHYLCAHRTPVVGRAIRSLFGSKQRRLPEHSESAAGAMGSAESHTLLCRKTSPSYSPDHYSASYVNGSKPTGWMGGIGNQHYIGEDRKNEARLQGASEPSLSRGLRAAWKEVNFQDVSETKPLSNLMQVSHYVVPGCLLVSIHAVNSVGASAMVSKQQCAIACAGCLAAFSGGIRY